MFDGRQMEAIATLGVGTREKMLFRFSILLSLSVTDKNVDNSRNVCICVYKCARLLVLGIIWIGFRMVYIIATDVSNENEDMNFQLSLRIPFKSCWKFVFVHFVVYFFFCAFNSELISHVRFIRVHILHFQIGFFL